MRIGGIFVNISVATYSEKYEKEGRNFLCKILTLGIKKFLVTIKT